MSVPHFPASRHDRPHARLYDHDLTHPAWKGLSGNAFKLICCLMAKWRPDRPNSFPVGGNTVAKLIDVDPKTAKKLVDELIEKGHVREERKGRNRGLVKTRERVVSLTRYDTETIAGDPSLPIKIWKLNRKQEKQPKEHGKKSGFENPGQAMNASDGRRNVVVLTIDNTRI